MLFNALPAYAYGARHIWSMAAPQRVAFARTAVSADEAAAPAEQDDDEVRSHQRMISVATYAMRQIETLERSLQPVE
jgi:hypothetical protein